MCSREAVLRAATVGAATERLVAPTGGNLGGHAHLMVATERGTAPHPPMRATAPPLAQSCAPPARRDGVVELTRGEAALRANSAEQDDAASGVPHSELQRRRAVAAVQAETAEALRYVLLTPAERRMEFEHSARTPQAAETDGPGAAASSVAAAAAARASLTAAVPGLRTTLERRAMACPRLVDATQRAVESAPPGAAFTPSDEAQPLALDALSQHELSFVNVALLLLRERNPQHRFLYALQRDVAAAVHEACRVPAANDASDRTATANEGRSEPSAQALLVPH